MSDARILRIFISYAHEDSKLAIAVFNALQAALDNTLSEVFLDIMSLEAGKEFKLKIEDQLDKTDILLIIYTGTEKLSHSYTGFEVGYFRNSQKRQLATADIPRKIVSLYLKTPPSTESGIEGVSFGIGPEALAKTGDEFAHDLRTQVDQHHPMVRFFEELREILADIRRIGKFPKGATTPDISECVRTMLLAIFEYLKTTVERTLKPQKQFTIVTSKWGLEDSAGNLPKDALLVPVGGGSPMSIFSLPEVAVRWDDFQTQTAHQKMSVSWRQAINSVVSSALQNQIDVDNSQIICSSDDTHLYRLILTASTTYFNGKREFNIYLVEALRPRDYGDKETTLLLKGLGMVCRFRFLFLEVNSEFLSNNIRTVSAAKLPVLARRLLREVDLLVGAASEADLDEPSDWSRFVDWQTIVDMSQQWAAHEPGLRKASEALVHASEPTHMEALRLELAQAVQSLAEGMDGLNRTLIEQMANRLKAAVKREPIRRKATLTRLPTRPRVAAG